MHGQRANNGLIQGFQRARRIMIEGNCIESCSGKMGYSLFKILDQFSRFSLRLLNQGLLYDYISH